MQHGDREHLLERIAKALGVTKSIHVPVNVYLSQFTTRSIFLTLCPLLRAAKQKVKLGPSPHEFFEPRATTCPSVSPPANQTTADGCMMGQYSS